MFTKLKIWTMTSGKSHSTLSTIIKGSLVETVECYQVNTMLNTKLNTSALFKKGAQETSFSEGTESEKRAHRDIIFSGD